MKFLKRFYFAVILAMAPLLVLAAVPTIPTFQDGLRLIDGTELNKAMTALRNLLAGTADFTSISTGAIVGSDSSLGIAGQAAAQGGAVALVGGTSSTTGNAGGAVTAVGGTPGATGVGGAITLTAGAGGATSGAGGASSLRGGAATASNSAGGASSVVAGAGSGSSAGGGVALTGGAGGATGAGGALSLTSGAGGATSGAAGAISLAVGSATSANGSSITISAGAGAGSTNAGGDVNLVPGAAVSTGIPGKIKLNGDANLMCASYYFTGTPAATDQVFYVATRPLIVTSVSEVHSAAAGGASALQVTKDSTTSAPGAGTDLLTNNTNTGFDLAATANTVQNGTLSATIATLTLAAGDRLAVDFANAIQSSAGVVVTACMAPL